MGEGWQREAVGKQRDGQNVDHQFLHSQRIFRCRGLQNSERRLESGMRRGRDGDDLASIGLLIGNRNNEKEERKDHG